MRQFSPNKTEKLKNNKSDKQVMPAKYKCNTSRDVKQKHEVKDS